MAPTQKQNNKRHKSVDIVIIEESSQHEPLWGTQVRIYEYPNNQKCRDVANVLVVERQGKFVAGGKGLEIERFTFQERVSNRTFLFWLPVAADWKCISYECWISFTGNQASRNLLWRWFVLVRHFRTPVDVIVFLLILCTIYKEHLLRVSCGFAWPCHLCIVQQMFVLNYLFP